MDDDTEYAEADLGPWREPLDDDMDGDGDEGDGECFVSLSSRNTVGASRSAAVERWLRMPHHYSLREYLDEHDSRLLAEKQARQCPKLSVDVLAKRSG